MAKNKEKRFDVAFSFAGQRRKYVQEVADYLSTTLLKREKVLYDKYHRAELNGIDTDTRLQGLYKDESALIVVFVCEDYNTKEWCGLELRVIRDMIKRKETDKFMFFRFHPVEIEGIYSIDGHEDIENKTPAEIALRILERLKVQGVISAVIPEHHIPRATTFDHIIGGKSYTIPHKITFVPGIDSSEVFGRENDLKNLEQHFQQSSKVALLNGMGGIGKTTLAKDYVQQHGGQYKHVAWIDCLQSFKNSIAFNKQLVQNLGLEFTKEDEESRYVEIMSRLSLLTGPNLLVIDNANETINEEVNRLPDSAHWKVLVTSRTELADFKKMRLDVLHESDAVKMFKELYGSEITNEAGLKKLLEKVGRHTLTIELLAKTAKNRHISVDELIKKFSEKGLQFSETKVTAGHEKAKTPDSLTRILAQVFDDAALSKDELHLLLQFALMPSIDIAFNKLTDLLQIEEKEQDNFSDLLNKLASNGWLMNSVHDFKCHQVIQEVVRLKQGKIELADCEKLVVSLGDKLYVDAAKDNPVDKFPWVEWGEMLLLHLDGDAHRIMRLENNLGLRYKDLGNFQKAKELLEAALKSGIKNFGEDDNIVAVIHSGLGLVYSELGNFEGARELHEAALKAGIKKFGGNHHEVAARQSNLAMVYKDLGDLEKARDLLERALKSDIKNLGEDHPTVAIRQSNLGLVYKDLGNLEKAKNLLERALKSDIKNFGEDHPYVAIDQSGLALVHQVLGDLEKARDLLERALKSDIKNFGENHPTVAITKTNLGIVYLQLNDTTRAKALIESAYQISMNWLGAANPQTVTIRSWLDSLK